MRGKEEKEMMEIRGRDLEREVKGKDEKRIKINRGISQINNQI